MHQYHLSLEYAGYSRSFNTPPLQYARYRKWFVRSQRPGRSQEDSFVFSVRTRYIVTYRDHAINIIAILLCTWVYTTFPPIVLVLGVYTYAAGSVYE